MVFGGDDPDFCVDTVKEVSRMCIWDLMTDVYILVFEEVCLSIEFCAQSSKGIMTLTDSKLCFHQDQLRQTLAQDIGR